MTAYFQTLNGLHVLYPRGLPIDGKATQVRLPVQNLPVPPFLVPAALDRLTKSKYASIIEVVPGEADPYCALLAQEKGAIILTSDSDLALFDIGSEGAVAFFHGLSQRPQADANNAKTSCRGWHARIWQYQDISQRLGVDLQRFAYEVKQNPPVRLSQALENAKGKLADTTSFDDFMVEYNLRAVMQPILSMDLANSRRGKFDPRLNELVTQIIDSLTEEPHMYLPVLLCDPSRATAWQPSYPIRKVVYSLLITAFRPANNHLRGILEHDARRPSQPNLIKITAEVSEEVKNLKSSLLLHSTFENFALCTALSYLGSVPMISEIYPKTYRSWHHIHVLAQVHGILYCLRLLKQILELVIALGPGITASIAESENRLTPSLIECSMALYSELESLPDLAVLLPRGIERKDFLEAVVKVHQHDEQHDGQEEAYRSRTPTESGAFTPVRHKKSKRKATEAVVHADKQRPTLGSGYYGILEIEE